MTDINCDRWTCRFYDDKKCCADVVSLETQGDCDLCCLTFMNYDPEVRNAQKTAATKEKLEKAAKDTKQILLTEKLK